MDRESIILLACSYYNYKWPKELYTGVMFFMGEKITIKDFNKSAKPFK